MPMTPEDFARQLYIQTFAAAMEALIAKTTDNTGNPGVSDPVLISRVGMIARQSVHAVCGEKGLSACPIVI